MVNFSPLAAGICWRVWGTPSHFTSWQHYCMAYSTLVSQKNDPPLICYTFDTCECILMFFGRNVTDKGSNQKTLYCATSIHVCFCTSWQTRKHENCIFSLKCCISALPEFNQSLLDFFSLFNSQLLLNKSCNQCVQLGLLGAWSRRK